MKLYSVFRRFLPMWLVAVAACLQAEAQNFDSTTDYRITSAALEGAVQAVSYGYYAQGEVNYTSETSNYTDACYWRFEKDGKYWRIRSVSLNVYLAYKHGVDTYTYGGQTYSYDYDALGFDVTVSNDTARWIIEGDGENFYFRNAARPEYLLTVQSTQWGDYWYSTVYMANLPENSTDGGGAMRVFDRAGNEVAAPGKLSGPADAVRLNGKPLIYDRESQDLFYPLSESLRGGKAFEFSTSFDGLEEGASYEAIIEGALTTASGYAIPNVQCASPYKLTFKGKNGTADDGPYDLYFTFLPIVEISSSKSFSRSDYVDGKFRLHDPDRTETDTTFTAKLRYRGASATNYAKKSFNVKLYEADATTDFDANLLGLRTDHTWILDAMAIDRIRMRNRVCFDTWNAIDRVPYATNYNERNGTVGRFVEVFLNGKYHGLYCFTDKVNRKLLNLTKVLQDTETGTVTPRGLLYKGKQWGNDTYLSNVASAQLSTTATWGNWELSYPDDYPSQAAWLPLRNLITSNGVSDSLFCARFDENYYFDNVLHYVLLQLAYNLEDNGMKNMYLSTKNTQKFGHRFLFTVWDMDSSLGGLWNGSRNDEMANEAYVTRVKPLRRLYSNNLLGFKDSLRVAWAELKETTLSLDSVARRLNRYKELIKEAGAWKREAGKWSLYANGGYVMPEITDLDAEVDYVIDWYSRNMARLDELLPPYERPDSGEATGILPITQRTPQRQGIFTLDGRRLNAQSVSQLPPGVYIVNGRKIVR